MNNNPSSESQVITVDVLKANDLLRNSGYRYLDVRTEEEYKKEHIDFDDALNIPNMFNTPEGRVKNPNFMEQVLQVYTTDDHLVVFGFITKPGEGSRQRVNEDLLSMVVGREILHHHCDYILYRRLPRPQILGCRSGVRSLYATTDLLDAGFKHVFNMGGGYLAWAENGLPVIVEPLEVDSKPIIPSTTN